MSRGGRDAAGERGEATSPPPTGAWRVSTGHPSLGCSAGDADICKGEPRPPPACRRPAHPQGRAAATPGVPAPRSLNGRTRFPGGDRCSAPDLRPDGPTLVATPLGADHQVAGRVPLPLETEPPYESQRRSVRRLDVRLQAMQAELLEGDVHHRSETRRHEAAPRVGREGAVAQLRGLERAPDDVAHAHVAGELAAGSVADEVGLLVVPLEMPQPGLEADGGVRRVDPGGVEGPARADRIDERIPISGADGRHGDRYSHVTRTRRSPQSRRSSLDPGSVASAAIQRFQSIR